MTMEVIEAMMEAGMEPADEHDVRWVRDHWEGVSAAKEEFGAYVLAVYTLNEVMVSVATATGLVNATVEFVARDGELDAARAAAMIAVIRTWSE